MCQILVLKSLHTQVVVCEEVEWEPGDSVVDEVEDEGVVRERLGVVDGIDVDISTRHFLVALVTSTRSL